MIDLERGIEGAVEFTADKYAASEFLVTGFEDPRGVSGSAEQAHRQSTEGHLEAVANPTRISSGPMEAGVIYNV